MHGLCSPHWCVGGDFNAIRYPTEKLGGSRITASMRSFDGFIRDCELKDIPLSNAQFTWSVNRGRVMSSRIDRFLVTSLWEDQFPDLIQETLVRPVSDHFPLLLESSRVKWGPTPFRFENMWLQHHSFLDQVKTWWEECPVTGWEGFKFMKKLKYIKEKIRTWNKEVFGDIRVKKREILHELEVLDRLESEGGLVEDQGVRMVALRNELDEVLSREEISWRQKVRTKWVKDGDVNSSYFHKVANGKRRKSWIKELELDRGRVVRNVDLISKEITNFYKELYTEEVMERPFLEGLDWDPIESTKAAWLERPFEEEEVKKAIWTMDKEKAPGPDGFNMVFFQACWSFLKEDLLKVFNEFYYNGKINTSMNSTFITLVPKKNRSIKVRDFRPISLVSSVYKVISKVLSLRLGEILGDTISENQNAFVGGRQILDAALVANEVVEDVRRRKQKGMVFKLDFEKAYDRVNWDFLDRVFCRKGFGDRWRGWIKGCLSSVVFSVIVNGEPKEWFRGFRGVRQGDPLSPFLFTLVVDVLSRMLARGVETGVVKGLEVGNEGLEISHLQFADDTILFLSEDRDKFYNVLSLLQIFEVVSGLRINLSKCGLAGINVEDSRVGQLAVMVGCEVTPWPLTYLGVPLGGNPRAETFWDPVIQRISKRLDSWKGVHFSLGGRITLIQASLSSIPLYFLSLFKIPVKVAKRIENIMRDFLWSRKDDTKRDHLVSWKVCCQSKEDGGLGLGNLVAKNISLVAKWHWRFPLETTSLWHRVIRSKYGVQQNGWDANIGIGATHASPWKFISQVYHSFSSLLSLRVGDGTRIRFWEDLWIGESSFLELFPRLYRVSSLHNAPISEFFTSQDNQLSWNFHFIRNLNYRLASEVVLLLNILAPFRVLSIPDRRIWSLESAGVYTCSSFFKYLSRSSNPTSVILSNFFWKIKAPSKVKAFVWTAVLNRINTNDLLQIRRPNKALSPNVCVMCFQSAETNSHLFLHCEVARFVWDKLFGIFGEYWVCPADLGAFFANRCVGFGRRKDQKALWYCAVLAILWCLWLERNDRIFKNKFLPPHLLWDRITFLSSLWVSSNGLFSGVSLSDIQRDWKALLY